MRKFFAKLAINIFNYIFKKQALQHNKRMAHLNNKILSGSVAGKKVHTSSCVTLTIDNDSKNQKKANQEKIEKIVSTFKDSPEKLFEYIKGAGTRVAKLKNADKILEFIGEKEGFILPQEGFKALYLNLLLDCKIAFKTPEMFILRNFNVNSYAAIYQFYNWYCYKLKLDGYDKSTQKKFKHVFQMCETDKIDELSFDEIMSLKSAIRRDIEAIDFVKKLAVKNSMAKKNLEKIKQGKLVRI